MDSYGFPSELMLPGKGESRQSSSSLPREKWLLQEWSRTRLSPGPATLPVSQLFHFTSLQLKGISTVWISKRERGKKKKKEIFDKPDGELNQVQVVTINSIFFLPPFKYHNNSEFISPKIKQSVDIKAE